MVEGREPAKHRPNKKGKKGKKVSAKEEEKKDEDEEYIVWFGKYSGGA